MSQQRSPKSISFSFLCWFVLLCFTHTNLVWAKGDPFSYLSPHSKIAKVPYHVVKPAINLTNAKDTVTLETEKQVKLLTASWSDRVREWFPHYKRSLAILIFGLFLSLFATAGHAFIHKDVTNVNPHTGEKGIFVTAQVERGDTLWEEGRDNWRFIYNANPQLYNRTGNELETPEKEVVMIYPGEEITIPADVVQKQQIQLKPELVQKIQQLRTAPTPSVQPGKAVVVPSAKPTQPSKVVTQPPKELQQTQIPLRNLQTQVGQLQGQLKQLQAQVAQKQQEEQKLDQQINQLSTQIGKAKGEIQRLQTQAKGLKQIPETTQKRQEIETAVAQLITRREQLESDVRTLEQKRGAVATAFSQLNTEVSGANQKLVQAQKTLKQAQVSTEALRKEHLALERQVDQLKQSRQQAQTVFEQAQQKQREAESELHQLNQQVEKAKKDLADLKRKGFIERLLPIGLLASFLGVIAAGGIWFWRKGRWQRLNQQIRDLQAIKATLEQEVTGARTELGQSRQEIGGIQQQRQELEQRQRELDRRENILSYQQRYVSLMPQVVSTANAEQLTQLEQRLNELNQEIPMEVAAELTSARQQVEQAIVQIRQRIEQQLTLQLPIPSEPEQVETTIELPEPEVVETAEPQQATEEAMLEEPPLIQEEAVQETMEQEVLTEQPSQEVIAQVPVLEIPTEEVEVPLLEIIPGQGRMWIEQLQSSKDARVRAKATSELGEEEFDLNRTVAFELGKALRNDKNKEVRYHAAASLGAIKVRQSISDLVGALGRESDRPVKIEIIRAIGKILEGIGDDKAIHALSETMERESRTTIFSWSLLENVRKIKSFEIRRGIIFSLRNIRDKEVLPILLKALREDKHPLVRSAAGEAYLDVGREEVVPEALKYLNDPAPGVRELLVEGIGDLRDPRGVSEIARLLLEDKDAGVREKTALALGYIGDVQTLPSLRRALESEKDTEVRKRIAFALGKLGDVEMLSQIEQLLQSEGDTAGLVEGAIHRLRELIRRRQEQSGIEQGVTVEGGGMELPAERNIQGLILDLDETIAPLGRPVPEHINRELMNSLESGKKIAVITLDLEEKMRARLWGQIPTNLRENLHIFSNGGTIGFGFDNQGNVVSYFRHTLTSEEKEAILNVVNSVIPSNLYRNIPLDYKVKIELDQKIRRNRKEFARRIQEGLDQAGIPGIVVLQSNKDINILKFDKVMAARFFMGKTGLREEEVVIIGDKARSFGLDRRLLTSFPRAISINIGSSSPTIRNENPNIIQTEPKNLTATASILEAINDRRLTTLLPNVALDFETYPRIAGDEREQSILAIIEVIDRNRITASEEKITSDMQFIVALPNLPVRWVEYKEGQWYLFEKDDQGRITSFELRSSMTRAPITENTIAIRQAEVQLDAEGWVDLPLFLFPRGVPPIPLVEAGGLIMLEMDQFKIVEFPYKGFISPAFFVHPGTEELRNKEINSNRLISEDDTELKRVTKNQYEVAQKQYKDARILLGWHSHPAGEPVLNEQEEKNMQVITDPHYELIFTPRGVGFWKYWLENDRVTKTRLFYTDQTDQVEDWQSAVHRTLLELLMQSQPAQLGEFTTALERLRQAGRSLREADHIGAQRIRQEDLEDFGLDRVMEWQRRLDEAKSEYSTATTELLKYAQLEEVIFDTNGVPELSQGELIATFGEEESTTSIYEYVEYNPKSYVATTSLPGYSIELAGVGTGTETRMRPEDFFQRSQEGKIKKITPPHSVITPTEFAPVSYLEQSL